MAYGGWYHWPAAAKCPDDGTPVGTNGCTSHVRATPSFYTVIARHCLGIYTV
jgi:hypothetical protein